MLGSSVYSSASDSRLELLRVEDLKVCVCVQTCSQGGELEMLCSSSSLSNDPEFNNKSSQLTSKVLFSCFNHLCQSGRPLA